MTLRQNLHALPFVTLRAKGIDFWDVRESGNPTFDHDTGRVYGALFLHFVREHDAPFLADRVLSRMVEVGGSNIGSTAAGFLTEFNAALPYVPANATVGLQTAAGIRFADSLDAALPQVPFVRRLPCGALDYCAVAPSGDWSRDCATGRHHAAVWAHFVRKFPTVNIAPEIYRSRQGKPGLTERMAGYLAGFRTHLCEILMAASPTCTEHQAGTLDLHRLRHPQAA